MFNKVVSFLKNSSVIYIAGLVLICFLSFGMTLFCFFSSDDMWQVHFAYSVFNGKTELIWRNFTSNYLQLPGLGFYRPLLGFTYLFDYWVYGVWASGWHLTNLILYVFNVLLLFIIMKRLTRTWPGANSDAAAFFTAALFAVSPLHSEPVCWISGRADLLCGPFYLFAIWATIKSHQDRIKSYYYLALLSFFFSMLSKEIGIGLPAVIAIYFFVWPREDKFPNLETKTNNETNTGQKEKKKKSRQKVHEEKILSKAKKKSKSKLKTKDNPKQNSKKTIQEQTPKYTIKQRLLIALKMSFPFVIVALIYLTIRFLALGTVVGGYTGAMGTFLWRDLQFKWSDLLHLEKIILPIATTVEEQSIWPVVIMKATLVLSVLLATVRAINRSISSNWVLFILFWFMSGFLPVICLWRIGENLESSRMLFFCTMAICSAFPVLLFHPLTKSSKRFISPQTDLKIRLLAATTIFIMILSQTWSLYSSTFLWLEAGKQLESIFKRTTNLVNNIPRDKRILVLGLPQSNKGGHILVNDSQFHHLLRPPFTTEDISEKVISFNPYLLGSANIINSTRFKLLLSNKDIIGPFLWRPEKKNYEPVKFEGNTNLPEVLKFPINLSDGNNSIGWKLIGDGKASKSDATITRIEGTGHSDSLVLNGLYLSPLKYDYLEFYARVHKADKDKWNEIPFSMSWNIAPERVSKNIKVNTGIKNNNSKKVFRLRFRQSHYWRWYTQGAIKSINIHLPRNASLEISEIKICSGANMIPLVLPVGLSPRASGEYLLMEKSEPVKIFYDTTSIKNAANTELMISKPNHFFDKLDLGEHWYECKKLIYIDSPKGNCELNPELFKTPAYYQIRVRGLDKNEKPVGLYSDSITILKLGNGLEQFVK